MTFILANPIISGIIASTLFAILWQLVGYLSGWVRTPLDFVASIAGGGIVRKFSNMNAARRWLRPAVEGSREIKFLAVRGFPLTQETYALHEILCDCYNPRKHHSVRVLVIDPDGHEAPRRAAEYRRLAVESETTYLHQIRDSINTLLDMKASFPTLEIRLYDSPVLARVLICDSVCFASFYTDKLTGLTSPVLMIKSTGLLYNFFDRYFEATWRAAKDVTAKYP